MQTKCKSWYGDLSIVIQEYAIIYIHEKCMRIKKFIRDFTFSDINKIVFKNK